MSIYSTISQPEFQRTMIVPVANRRRMSRAELLGLHSHQTVCGKTVHVWIRDSKYLGGRRVRE